MSDNNHNGLKMAVIGLVIIAAGGWTYQRAKNVTPGAKANNGQTEEFQRPDPAEMRDLMKTAAAYADFSTTQVAAMEKGMEEMRKRMENRDPNTTRGAWRDRATSGTGMGPGRMGGFEEIATPEQREKIREFMGTQRAQRDQKVKAALGKEEYERYRAKRPQRGGGRGGPGGGQQPGGGGGQQPGR
ncbi:hypothetical protein CVU37_02795 [candidate division BRC1 bacterium HGW-BRC1-1]|jgi:hypothetical protein|nr:MAG: hypothetical protein CVU37_02795 [candidate division BRC1 bacterium HGW-BRC1-1]